jgi:hypothetical protein
MKRPESGIPTTELLALIGMRLRRPVDCYAMILTDDLEKVE